MQNHIDNKTFHIEILTPKQNSPKLEEDLEKFAEKYMKVIEAGYIACITDNPMGHLSFQTTEVLPELDLPVEPEQLVIHLNTFHTREHLDEILTQAADMGVKYLLTLSGDGSERLPKLTPESIGMDCNTVTSIELLSFIHKNYPNTFSCGVAFNPYEPPDHEKERLEKKLDAGAEYIITQPVIGDDPIVHGLKKFGVPVIIDAWMSKKLHLLSECVGYEIPEDTPYDPVDNLGKLATLYPEYGLYLALLGFKTQYPLLKDIWK